MGDLVLFKVTDRVLLKRIFREAEQEITRLRTLAQWEYQVTAGFTDPPPASSDPTVRCLWEMGLIEL